MAAEAAGGLCGEETFFATVLVVKSWRPSSDNESGLPINENEIIDVEDTETIDSWRDDTWWYGSKVGNRQSGWFPSANTKIIQHKPPLEEEAVAVVDSKFKHKETIEAPADANGSLSTPSAAPAAPAATAPPPPRRTMRVLRQYTGPGTQVAIDGRQDPEAATSGPFTVEKDDVVQVHTSKVREAALLEEFEDVFFCKNLRSGEYGWVPCSHLQEMRRGSAAQISSAPTVTSNALGGTSAVLSSSTSVLSRASSRLAAPDWVIHHAATSSLEFEGGGRGRRHSGFSSSQSTSPSGTQERGQSGSGSVSSRSRSCSQIGTLPMLSSGTTNGHDGCEKRPVDSSLKSRHRRGRPKKLQLANEFNEFNVDISTSSDDEDFDGNFDQAAAAAFSNRRRSCDMPRASRTNAQSPSPRSGDDLLQRFRRGDVPHTSPLSRSKVGLSSPTRFSTSPQTKPKGSLDQIAVLSKAPLESGDSGNRFRHHDTGRVTFIARTLQSPSSVGSGTEKAAHSLPSSPMLKPLGETSTIFHQQSQEDVFNGAERKPMAQVPTSIRSSTRLRPSSRSGGGSRVATEAYSSMMSALLSPPRAFVLPGTSAALPSLGASTSPTNPRTGESELEPSALAGDHTTPGSSESSEQIATIGRSGRSTLAAAGSKLGMDLGTGDDNDEDTTLAWLLQQQEVARVHGTGVAYDVQRSQQVLDEFLVQNSPTNRHSSDSATRQRARARSNDEPVQASSGGTSPTQGTNPNSEAANGGMECIICFDNIIDTALYPCWHIICCSQCAKRVTKCPQCRRKIKFRQRVFIK